MGPPQLLWATHTSASLSPWFKNFSLSPDLNLTTCSSPLSHHSSFNKPLFKYSKGTMKCPWSLLFSRPNNPSGFSLPLWEGCSSPQSIFVALLCTCSRICAEQVFCLAGFMLSMPDLDAVFLLGSHKCTVDCC